VSLLASSSCSQLPAALQTARDPDVVDRVRSIDIDPRYPRQFNSSDQTATTRPKASVYVGDESSQAPETTASISPSAEPAALGAASVGGGYELNFEAAPIPTVAKVVLGDILKTGYSIDPRVQGTVSLASVRPIAKTDMLYVLENALRQSGVVLVHDSAGYRLLPLSEAVGTGVTDTAARAEPGYGISVVPLQYIGAPTLMKLMDSFAAKPGTVRADPGRNILLIQGTGAERRAAIETALSFDVDWMRGRSVGIFPVQNSSPEPVIAELEKILDTGENGLGQGVVKLQPVSRLNAIMVVSSKAALLRTAEKWISRLDNADTTRSTVHVYRIKYGEAKQMARVLNEMFAGLAASGNDNNNNQIAPGGGVATRSSTDRLSLNGTTNTSAPGTSKLASAMNGAFGVGAGAGATPQGSQDALPQSSTNSDKALIPGMRITADSTNNTLLIYASQDNYKLVERTLQQLDRPQLQVAIDATVAEVTLNDELSYGVQAYITSKNLGLKPDKGSILNTNSSTTPVASAAGAAGAAANAFLSRTFPGFNFLVGPESQPTAILDALHAVTDVKVLSNPSLVVIDNQPATLQVGDQVPVSTGSATVLTANNTIVNTIDYRNTGIILHVVPRINVNGNVRLDVEQEISNVSNTTGQQTLTPTVSERHVRSSISVASGQTVLLAGLISERESGQRNGVPFLDQLPGIGDAFAHSDKAITRTELIIFIRPQIIRDSADAHFVAEEVRSKLRGTFSRSGSSQRP
jgi:general secretion pathway protein D